MSAIAKRVAKLEADAIAADGVGRVVLVMGPAAMSGREILERYCIPAQPDDFYIHVVGVAPEGQPPADNPCAVCIAGKWLVSDDKRTGVAL